MALPNILIATDFAAGGIVTTILNNQEIEWNSRLEGSVESAEHDTIKFNFARLDMCKPGIWYHTHNEKVPVEKFDKKIIITTEANESRYVLLQRCQKFMNPDWIENDTMASIDKIRELAKTFAVPKVTKARENMESVELIDLLNEKHTLFDVKNPTWLTWKAANTYLYTENAWLQKRYDEALWEIENKQFYKYS